jgi:putative ABC transport system ATP-binding protein
MRALDQVGLSGRVHHTPNQLSGGQQQRVAIARALVTDPPLLLADEPTGNLDTRTSYEVLGLLQKLNRENGITIIIVTHEHDIAECASRVITVRDGTIKSDVRQETPRDALRELAELAPAS